MVRRRTQRGASALEFVIVMGLVVSVFLMVLQYALRSHAEHVAQAAAEAGLEIARAYDGTVGEARARALTRVADVTSTPLHGVEVEIDRTAQTATVTVLLDAQRVVPGIDVQVEQVVSGPVERTSTGPVTP